jgi:hypothetical protein
MPYVAAAAETGHPAQEVPVSDSESICLPRTWRRLVKLRRPAILSRPGQERFGRGIFPRNRGTADQRKSARGKCSLHHAAPVEARNRTRSSYAIHAHSLLYSSAHCIRSARVHQCDHGSARSFQPPRKPALEHDHNQQERATDEIFPKGIELKRSLAPLEVQGHEDQAEQEHADQRAAD